MKDTIPRLCRWMAALWVLELISGCAGPSSVLEPTSSTPHSQSTLNVMNFGATGDGIKDDTRAFQAALSQIRVAGGGVLFIPSGTYLVGELQVASGTMVQGATSNRPVLVMRRGAPNLLRTPRPDATGHLAGSHDIQFDSLILKGRSVIDGFATSQSQHLIRLIGVSRVKVTHVAFFAFQSDGVYVGTRAKDDSTRHNFDVTVSDNTFDGVNHANRNGVSVIDCQRCLIENNSFQNIGNSSMPGPIDLEPNFRYEVINGISIRNNTFENTTGSSGAISMLLHFKDFDSTPGNVEIAHNTIEQTVNGVRIAWFGPANTAPGSMQTAIHDNTINRAQHGIVLDGVAGIDLTSNVVQSSTQEIVVGDEFGASNIVFRTNQFIQLGGDSGKGVVLNGPLTNIVFDGNQFVDIGANGQGLATFFAQGSSTGITFARNTYRSPQKITRFAVDAAPGFGFNPGSNTWQDNVLMDGIQIGTFPLK